MSRQLDPPALGVPAATDVRAAASPRWPWLTTLVPASWALVAPQFVGVDPYRAVLALLLALAGYAVVTGRGRRRELLDHVEEHGMTVPVVLAHVRDDWSRDLGPHPAHEPWQSVLDRVRVAAREIELLVADLPASLAERLWDTAAATSAAVVRLLVRRDELGWDLHSSRSETMATGYLRGAEAHVVQLEAAAARLLAAATPTAAEDLVAETEATLQAWSEVEAADGPGAAGGGPWRGTTPGD